MKLIQSCKTRSELTLLLRTGTLSTLHRIYEGCNLLSFPYGGGISYNNGLLIRDFVEYEFQKREGKKFGAYFDPHSLVKALPACVPLVDIEGIAHDDLNEGIKWEKDRVKNFAFGVLSNPDFKAVIQKFDSVRYMDKTTDGFIDTFRMIFNAYDDENPIKKICNDRVFKEQVKRQILFWGKQWARQDEFAILKGDKIHQLLQLARLDAWIDVIADTDFSYGEHKFLDVKLIDITDGKDNSQPEAEDIAPEECKQTANDDFIDVEFTDVTENTKIDVHSENHELPALPEANSITPEKEQYTAEPVSNEHHDESHEHSADDVNSHPEQKPITCDDWRRVTERVKAAYDDIRKFRRKISYSKKFQQKRLYNPPLRKSELLPGQITIPFTK